MIILLLLVLIVGAIIVIIAKKLIRKHRIKDTHGTDRVKYISNEDGHLAMEDGSRNSYGFDNQAVSFFSI